MYFEPAQLVLPILSTCQRSPSITSYRSRVSTADTLYYYSVGSTAQVLAAGDSGHFFVTAPPPEVAQPTRIWAIGDSGSADAHAAAEVH